MENKMILKIPALSQNESFARGVVAGFCITLNPTLDELTDIKTAVSEAVTNCIVHAYPNSEGEIEIKAEINGNFVTIEVRDFGVGIENLDKARTPFFTTKPLEERSGMGFTVMESFMDSVSVQTVKGGGVKVVMSKQIQSQSKIRKLG